MNKMLDFVTYLGQSIVVALLFITPLNAQGLQVQAAKNGSAIPKRCESVAAASIDDNQVDIAALVKEAACKGSGDMINECTYVLKSVKREKEKAGIKEQTLVYEVFMPTLKSGTRGKGILLLTSRDGVPTEPKELEKERARAGQELEKEEAKSSEHAIAHADTQPTTSGMVPIGTYSGFKTNQPKFAAASGMAVLNLQTFLRSCELVLTGREQNDGRESLVFNFTPRPGAHFNDDEKYIAALNGKLWIDVRDHIVSRLIGWPADLPEATRMSAPPPAIYLEMLRLPDGAWLPRVMQINGLDYPKLFDRVSHDSVLTYSNYVRYRTEVNDYKVGAPN